MERRLNDMAEERARLHAEKVELERQLEAGAYNRPLYKPQLSCFITCYH
jgi:hypothetical protein